MNGVTYRSEDTCILLNIVVETTEGRAPEKEFTGEDMDDCIVLNDGSD